MLAAADIVEITGALKGCDDPDDDALIETAEIGAAEFLITGDSDLLDDRIRASLAGIGIEVITARAFLRARLVPHLTGEAVPDQARRIVAAQVGGVMASSTLTRGLNPRVPANREFEGFYKHHIDRQTKLL